MKVSEDSGSAAVLILRDGLPFNRRGGAVQYGPGFRVWRSWVARVPWAHEVVSSNLTTLTIFPKSVIGER